MRAGELTSYCGSGLVGAPFPASVLSARPLTARRCGVSGDGGPRSPDQAQTPRGTSHRSAGLDEDAPRGDIRPLPRWLPVGAGDSGCARRRAGGGGGPGRARRELRADWPPRPVAGCGDQALECEGRRGPGGGISRSGGDCGEGGADQASCARWPAVTAAG